MRPVVSSRVAAVLLAVGFILVTLILKQVMASSAQDSAASSNSTAVSTSATPTDQSQSVDPTGATDPGPTSMDTDPTVGPMAADKTAHEQACIPFIKMNGDLIKYGNKNKSVDLHTVVTDINKADAAAALDTPDVRDKILKADTFIRNEITGKTKVTNTSQMQAAINPAIEACSH